jgi:hypothetical protein
MVNIGNRALLIRRNLRPRFASILATIISWSEYVDDRFPTNIAREDITLRNLPGSGNYVLPPSSTTSLTISISAEGYFGVGNSLKTVT